MFAALCSDSWTCTKQQKKLSCPTCMLPADGSKALCSCFSSHVVNNCLFCSLLSATYFTFLCFLLILLFEMFLMLGAEVLAGVPKCKKAVTCLMEKIHFIIYFIFYPHPRIYIESDWKGGRVREKHQLNPIYTGLQPRTVP